MKILFLCDLYQDQINLYNGSLLFELEDSLKIIEKSQGWSHMMINGLKQIGHEVIPFLVWPGFNIELQRKIFAKICNFRPDILIIENPRLLSYSQISELKSNLNRCIFITHHCSKFKDDLEIFENYDKVLCCSPYFFKSLSLNKDKKIIFYNACPDEGFEISKENLNKITNKCTFFGSLYRKIHDDRKELLSYLLSRNLPLDIYSSSKGSTILSSITNKMNRLNISRKIVPFLNKLENLIFKLQYPELKDLLPPLYDSQMLAKLSNYTCCLNIHTKDANGFAANLRLFECASVATCLITENYSNIAELFEPGEEILTYESKEECFEKVKYCLDNPDFAQQIGDKARLRAKSDHTYYSRVLKLKI